MDEELSLFARGVIQTEADAVRSLLGAINESFERACHLILSSTGNVLTTGIGKAGHIARKISATFSSTGTPSHFLSATDAVHGDLGAVRRGDVLLVFSASGESDEILRLLSIVKKLDHPVIAVTSSATSSLGRFADAAIVMGRIEEACPLGLAPSASTTAMLALGDALALSVMKLRNFSADDFALYHPAGQLGRKLIKVKDAMTFKLGENLPVASDSATVAEVLQMKSRIKRAPGAIVLVDAAGTLTGLFTDGDLRRLVTTDDGTILQRRMRDVMTHNPKRIGADALASEAMAMMHAGRFDELPVVDPSNRAIGMIDVQDLVVLKMLDVDA